MIGSREWMNLSLGKLSFKEKAQFIKQVSVPALLNFGQTFIDKPSTISTFELKSIDLPDTAITLEAIQALESTESPSIIHHSWRSYIWAVAIAQTKQWQFDDESLLIACLMHDLGLVDHLEQYACQCFSFESALRAEALCIKHHYPANQTENISNAICLHMNGHLNEKDQTLSKEVLLLQKATSCDVIGTDSQHFSAEFKQQVLTQYPQLDFNTHFIQLINIESKRNPHSRTALLRQGGLSRMVQFNPLKSSIQD